MAEQANNMQQQQNLSVQQSSQKKRIKQIKKAPAAQQGVKQLPAPTNVVAEAIAQQVRSAVEI